MADSRAPEALTDPQAHTDPLALTGHDLTIDDVVAVSRGRTVAIHPDALPRMERSREVVDRLV
ncbi:MAG: hypothetical protein OXI19_02330, partial [Gemmatimonadota bacterium]|nr:hypothetical protein [Gemmatimonadota bacterium]